MQDKLKAASQYFLGAFKTWGLFFAVNFAVSVGIFFCLISNHLVNDLDGLWHSAHSFSGNWERCEGRWFWYYTDQIKAGMAFDPFSSFIAIALLIFGLILVLSIFELTPKNRISYLISLLYICTTSVVGWLSYRYMSQVFFTAFVMSVLAVYVLVKIRNNVLSVIIACCCISISMGCYQAFFSCTCLLMAVTLALYLYKNQNPKFMITYLVKCVITIIGGGLLYLAILNIILKIYDLQLSSYNGVSDISILSILMNLTSSIPKTYYCFNEYFFKNVFSYNYFQSKPVFIYAVFAFVIFYMIMGAYEIFKRNKVYAILFIACCALFPAASYGVIILAPESFVSLQMTTAVTLALPVCLCLIYNMNFNFKGNGLTRGILVALCCMVLYGNYIAVSIDQEACLEGQTATQTLCRDIIGALREDGYMDRGGKIAFIGTPSGNTRFLTSDLYPYANSLLRFGDWGDAYDAQRMSWGGAFRELCGYSLDICPDDQYGEIIESGAADSMPQFPQSGSIKVINDVTVVKVGDNYR